MRISACYMGRLIKAQVPKGFADLCVRIYSMFWKNKMKKHSLRIWTGWLAMASHLFRLVNPSSSWECSACTHLTHSRYSSLDNCRKEVNWLKTFYMRSLGFGNWLCALGSGPLFIWVILIPSVADFFNTITAPRSTGSVSLRIVTCGGILFLG